jgi:N-acetylglucosamine malate deacetylase 1
MPSVLALFAHPDDIEFVAAGTLLRLFDLGWDIHYCNLANGCCGSTVTDRNETARIRRLESEQSAALLKATFYPPICNDMEIFYTRENLAKVAAIVRQSRPSIVLTHAIEDYMEDHMATCKLALTATFAKGIPNFASDPVCASYDGEVAIYHAQPHGNRSPLGEIVLPTLAVPIDSVLDRKLAMLSCHQSQQQWLQSSQGMNSYTQTMLDLGREVAGLAELSCQYAEGWRQHLHLGFGSSDFNPLKELIR